MKFYQFLIVFFIIVNKLTAVQQLDKNHSPFFPMKIGYAWYYSSYIDESDSTRYNEKWVIKDSIFVDNKLFFLFEVTYYGNNIVQDTIYYAVKNDSLFRIYSDKKLIKSSIELRAIFSQTHNDKFPTQFSTFYTEYGCLLNYSSSNFTFGYWIEDLNDSFYEVLFRKNIGIILSQGQFGSKLVKYSFGKEKIQ